MIVPMKKVSLVILNKDKETALKVLRKSGLVHLEKIEGTGEKLAGLKAKAAKLEEAFSLLGEVKTPKKGFSQISVSNDEALKMAQRTIEIVELKKSFFERIANDTNEINRLSAWGTVNPEDIKYLSDKGVYFALYEIPTDKFSLIGEDIQTITVNKTKGTIRFLLLSDKKECERPEALPPEAYQVVLPEVSTDAIKNRIAEAKSELVKLDKEFADNAAYLDSIKNYNKAIQKEIEFENVFSGMETEGEGSENDLSWVTGFIPEDKLDSLKKIASEQNWAIASSDPTEEDAVPTQLKNNKLVSLIYPLTDFLGTVPGYNEYDISGWFLLFFTIFFGMIFGDGGYGLLVTVISLLMLLKTKAKGKSSPMLALVFLVGLATVAWGTVTCTWFGLTPEQINSFAPWLINLSIQPISNAAAFMNGGKEYLLYLPWSDVGLTTGQNLQIFCFTLALLQLSVAHVKGIFRNLSNRSLKVLGELGSLVQLWGMFYVVLSMVVSSVIFPLDLVVNDIPVATTCIGMVLGGFALSFIFANYEGNLIKSILESVKNIISVLLGVVNVFSDIVSYIRLWAVGLAGAAISNTVNTMAGPLLGHAFMFAAAILLLVFGHGLNMILNLLSVIVHGVRLNTLEFSTHLGMSWSGFKYEPFSEAGNK